MCHNILLSYKDINAFNRLAADDLKYKELSVIYQKTKLDGNKEDVPLAEITKNVEKTKTNYWTFSESLAILRPRGFYSPFLFSDSYLNKNGFELFKLIYKYIRANPNQTIKESLEF